MVESIFNGSQKWLVGSTMRYGEEPFRMVSNHAEWWPNLRLGPGKTMRYGWTPCERVNKRLIESKLTMRQGCPPLIWLSVKTIRKGY